MNLKKGLLHTMAMGIAFVGIMCLAPGSQASYYNEGKLLKMNIPTYRRSGYAYNAGLESSVGTKEQHMWKIYEYNSTNATATTPKNRNNGIYCLKMGVGFGSSGGSATQDTVYKIYADMKNPSKPSKENPSAPDDASIIERYKEELPNEENYNAIVWLLDHFYVPAPESSNPTGEVAKAAEEFKKELLKNAGIPDSKMNDDIIDIVQQIALWYFTNEGQYKANVITNIDASLGTVYDSVDDVFDNWDLSEDISTLYQYFITEAGKNIGTPANSSVTNPITLNAEEAKVILQGENYIAGPYQITEIPDKVYALEAKLTASDETEIHYQLLDSNKQPTSASLKELIGQEFYLKLLPSMNQNIEGAKFKITTKIKQNTITYWQVAGSLANEQPVAEVIPQEISLSQEVTLSIKEFDLALRKFITHIGKEGEEVKPVSPSREPVITPETILALNTRTVKTVTKEHTKDPIEVNIGDTVIYTIRIYNEGSLSGYASEITDYLPEGLILKPNSDINNEYGWTNPSGDGKTIVTTKLADRLLQKFDGTTIDSADVQIECIVNAKASEAAQNLKNVAEITKDLDENKEEITDRDSTPNNLSEEEKKNYHPGTSTQGWGYEDDDDYEELLIPGKYFDLALRKFITHIGKEGEEVQPVSPSREPVIGAETISALQAGTIKTVTKEHTKDPIEVNIGDTVIYTIRIYNEGELNGYASEITDYLPEGLTLKPNSDINTEYGWTNPSGDKKTIVTTKLADRLLQAFDGTTIDQADVQVECIVNAEASGTAQNLKNVAEITKDLDEDKQEITDRDSIPKNLSEEEKKNYHPGTSTQGWGYEDDDDYEELVIPGKSFDLALRKFITNINGKELVKEDGSYLREPMIDITPLQNGSATTASYRHPKNPVGVSEGDTVIYTIRIYNEGEIDGYVKEITDYLPPQLEYVNDEFNAKYGWRQDGRIIKTTITSPDTEESASRDQLYADRTEAEDKVLLQKFNGTKLDYIEVKIKCKVVSNQNLDKVITNIAEITDFTDKQGNSVTDRDSQKANVILPADEDLPDYKGKDSNKSILTDSNYHYEGQQDDDDFEKLILENFDLALRKFITKVNETPVTNRIPVFTNVKDQNGNYIYEHTKEPIEVDSMDIVEYTLRIYNEGDISGYAKEIKDNIPAGLEFVPTHETNLAYRWKMLDENGNETTDISKAVSITTDYLSKEQEKTAGENLITAFDSTKTSPDYKEVKVVFKVTALNSYTGIITNIAEISDDSDEEGKPVEDKDSTPDNGDEKEDDIDKEHLKLSYFDLALRKFITAVNNTEITNRIPVFKVDENGNYVYEHTKEPVDVENGNIVTYTLRIFNEGTKDGYAKEIKDDLPEGLEFIPEHETNKEYRWVMIDENGEETQDITKATSIKTDYLSKEQEEETGRNNLLTKFNPETMEEPNHKDIKIAFKVTEPNTSDRILINKAQISDDSDKDGNDIIDKDSTPDKWIEGEDDQDIEKVKVKYFDLALRKWVTQAIVIDDGKETITETGHKAEDNPEEVVKVEIKESRLNKVVVKFRYKIRITNEGQIAGYATEISDYIPQGLKFVAADNPTWKEVDGKIVTDELKDTLLQPGETAEVEVLLTWINGKDNFDLKINVAEISKDKNDSNTPDIDSTPNNQKTGEDDIDDAPVILSIKTGVEQNIQYTVLITVTLAILSTGAILIKKYVLL